MKVSPTCTRMINGAANICIVFFPPSVVLEFTLNMNGSDFRRKIMIRRDLMLLRINYG